MVSSIFDCPIYSLCVQDILSEVRVFEQAAIQEEQRAIREMETALESEKYHSDSSDKQLAAKKRLAAKKVRS
jgi:hypothetical protein